MFVISYCFHGSVTSQPTGYSSSSSSSSHIFFHTVLFIFICFVAKINEMHTLIRNWSASSFPMCVYVCVSECEYGWMCVCVVIFSVLPFLIVFLPLKSLFFVFVFFFVNKNDKKIFSLLFSSVCCRLSKDCEIAEGFKMFGFSS